MSSVAVRHVGDASPKAMARIAGLLYLGIIAFGLFADIFVHERLVAYRDPAATAANILAHENLYRSGGVAILMMLACDVGVSIILYVLLKPVNRLLSLIAASFRLMQVAVLSVGALAHFAALVFVNSRQVLSAFNENQLNDFSLVSAKLYSQDFNIGMVFFGVHCLILGYLIARAYFLPRILGLLIAIAGCFYLISSFFSFLSPAIAGQVFYYLMLPCFIAELALTVWLVLRGVDEVRWREQVSRSSA